MQNRTHLIADRINELALITDQPGTITRTYGSPAFIKANKKIYDWFSLAGLQTHIDNLGNVRGRVSCGNAEAKTMVIASHADTVVNAGRYDGPLGIVMGLELVTKAILQNSSLPFNIELISFCDEEGVRFHTTYLGSKLIAGSFDKDLLTRKDQQNTTLGSVIKSMGGNIGDLDKDVIPADEWLGYFEVHIEQGPVLYDSDIPVGIVSSIAGQKRGAVVFTGDPGHAGTVPMPMRRDALCCAAECILAVEQFAQKNNLVATTGMIHVANQASNVIPGQVKCSLDIRSADEDELETAWQSISTLIMDICLKRKIQSDIQLIQSSLPVKCDYHLNYLLRQSIHQAGYAVKELVSGAGHDAVPISAVSPVSMMFVRCYKGISHNPLEDVEAKDIEAATEVGDRFLEHLIKYYNQP